MAFWVWARRVVLERSFAFPVKVLETMARERVTVFPGVPTLFVAAAGPGQRCASFDLSCAAHDHQHRRGAARRAHRGGCARCFPQAQLFSMYGLTECKRVTYLPPEQLDVRPDQRRPRHAEPGSAGWSTRTAGACPTAATGELVVRGSHVMRGYWEKPAETAERLQARARSPARWCCILGDLFRTDDDGWLYFVARKDDIIKSRGEKVSAARGRERDLRARRRARAAP